MEQPIKTKNTMSKRVIAIIIAAVAVIAIAAGVALEDRLFCVVDYSIGRTISRHAHNTQDMRVAA